MYGRTVLSNNSVIPTRVSADGNPEYKFGGITIDWGAVTASGSDTTLPDGSVIKANQKFLRYGQVMTKETTATSQTLTGTATGGTFTLTLIRPDTNQPVVTAALSATATAAQVLTALQAVLGPNQVLSTSGGALGTAAVTIVFGTFFPLVTVNGALLTGGTVTPAVTVTGTTGGYFGPYDPAATDGRQTLTRGEAFVLDETVLQYSTGSAALGASNDQIGGCIEGGAVFIDRVLNSGTATASLAAGPTLANLRTVFPRLREVKD